ncbi:MAG: hypothetical protein SFW65_03860 [Alphaproteobacteria bacterium]|nr:hypothetical protein [Alphaproteobacteria bacterium]
MLKLIALVLVTCVLSGSALAYGYGKAAPVPYPTPKTGSRLGNVTGGDCKTNEDCWQACTNKGDKLAVTCLSTGEGSSNCSDAESPPPGGLACECLQDSKHCGYAFPSNH